MRRSRRRRSRRRRSRRRTTIRSRCWTRLSRWSRGIRIR